MLGEADKINSKDLEIFQILDDITPQN
jgi:hypothetical protein